MSWYMYEEKTNSDIFTDPRLVYADHRVRAV
jgi:hypothetical protein